MQFFIANTVIDEMNYEEPIKKHIVSDMHFIIDPTRHFYKSADIFLNEVRIRTDNGYFPTLFPSLNSTKTFTYDQEFREQTVVNAQFNIADFYFRKSQTMFRYERSLGDLLAIISSVVGSWSTAYVCLMIFIRNYNRNYFIISLAKVKP